MILPRLRQVGTWFLLGLGVLVSAAVTIYLTYRRGRSLEAETRWRKTVEDTNDRVRLANARAAVEITAARTKNAAVKAELRDVVQSDRSEAEKVRELVALKNRMEGT